MHEKIFKKSNHSYIRCIQRNLLMTWTIFQDKIGGILVSLIFITVIFQSCYQSGSTEDIYNDTAQLNTLCFKGALIRTDTTLKNISLVFTAHEFAEGYSIVKEALDKHGIKASFFFTGDFYREPGYAILIHELVKEGHYVGAHSDQHLLYASWENRDSLLVSREEFTHDLLANYREMERFGISKGSARLFLPPYEWYNDSISKWCSQLGIILVNFTPGTIANHDWTLPEPGSLYYSSDSIFRNIMAYEESGNMNGFILLSHLGTDSCRTDKFYFMLDSLISELEFRGYQFPLLRDLVKLPD